MVAVFALRIKVFVLFGKTRDYFRTTFTLYISTLNFSEVGCNILIYKHIWELFSQELDGGDGGMGIIENQNIFGVKMNFDKNVLR